MKKNILAFALLLPLFGAGCFSSPRGTASIPIAPPPTPIGTTPLPVTSTTPTTPTTTVMDAKKGLITVSNFVSGQKIKSPFTLQGKARGNWYFEASFPYELKDSNGTTLASGPVQAQGNWMTTNFVPFSVTIAFPPPVTATGTLILKKDNPSGEPQNDDQLAILVTF